MSCGGEAGGRRQLALAARWQGPEEPTSSCGREAAGSGGGWRSARRSAGGGQLQRQEARLREQEEHLLLQERNIYQQVNASWRHAVYAETCSCSFSLLWSLHSPVLAPYDGLQEWLLDQEEAALEWRMSR